jgi:hypothetical protein
MLSVAVATCLPSRFQVDLAGQLLDVPRHELLQPLLLQWRRRAEVPAPWQQNSALAAWLRREDPFRPALPEAEPDEPEMQQLRR